MIRSWVWLALEKHDHPWALVPRAGSIRVGGHLEMTMITQWLGGYGWLKIKLLEVRKKKQPLWHVRFNFMSFFSNFTLESFSPGLLKAPKKHKKVINQEIHLFFVVSGFIPISTFEKLTPASGGEVWFRWAPQMGQFTGRDFFWDEELDVGGKMDPTFCRLYKYLAFFVENWKHGVSVNGAYTVYIHTVNIIYVICASQLLRWFSHHWFDSLYMIFVPKHI